MIFHTDGMSRSMRDEFVIATYVDVAEELVEAFREWQLEVQVAALHSSPGVLGASCLESVAGQPRFLLLCGLENEGVAGSGAVQAAFDWGYWTRHLRGWHRRTYRRIFASGSADDQSPYVLTVRVDVDREAKDAFNDWYNFTHLPETLDCPGFLSAARYECTDGEPQFLAMYELDRADALTTPEMKRVYGFGPMARHVRSEHGRIYARRPSQKSGERHDRV